MSNVANLLLFPKPAPIDTVDQIIKLSCGAETYQMTIHAKIERVTAQPRDRPSPDFQHGRKLELVQLESAPQGGDPDADRTSGPAPSTPDAELSCLCSPGGVMNVITAADAAPRTQPMNHFTIDSENNITVHGSHQAARDTGGAVFSTEVQFADLIGPDNKRLLDIWNSLPGVKRVTKFENRKKATERIWTAIQSLGEPAAAKPVHETEAASETKTQQEATTPTGEPEVVVSVGAQAADVAPAQARVTKKASPAEKAPQGEEKASRPAEKPKSDRSNKKAEVIAMMKRPQGATLPEIMAATGWQAHTVRGLVSILGSKEGQKIESSRNAVGERLYIVK